MKHEISIKYDDCSKEVKLLLNGSPLEIAKALEDSEKEGQLFLATMSAIIKFASPVNQKKSKLQY